MTAFACSRAAAQEMHYLQNRVAAQADSARMLARDTFQMLVDQPKDVRDAMLEVSQHPELIVRLRMMDAKAPDSMTRATAGYSAETQSSARVLASHPDVLASMENQLASTALVGRVYAEQKPRVHAIIERMSIEAAAVRQAALNGWNRRIASDAAAKEQLAVVVKEYSAQPGAAIAVTNELPPAGLAAHVLEHADRYPELAGVVVEQWEQERNPEVFRRTVDTWYAKGRDYLPNDFNGDAAQRVRVMREQAVLAKKLAAERGQAAFGSPLAAGDYIDKHASEFPSLIEVRQMKAWAAQASKPVRVAGGPWTKSGGSGSSSSSSRSGSSGTRSMGSSRSSRSSSSSLVGTTGSRRGRGSRNSRNSGDSQGGFGNSSGGFGGNGGFGGGSGGFGGGGGFGNSGGGFGNTGGSSGFGNTNSRFGSSSSSNR